MAVAFEEAFERLLAHESFNGINAFNATLFVVVGVDGIVHDQREKRVSLEAVKTSGAMGKAR
ncbi:hypothetical protein CCP3SC1AL1_170018 [Gammaproteobacteria bacterium]